MLFSNPCIENVLILKDVNLVQILRPFIEWKKFKLFIVHLLETVFMLLKSAVREVDFALRFPY